MAGTSLLALIDDISTLLDDVAVLSKVAAKKTAGVLGDDLALNAQQVAGVRAEREIPVVWAVAKGSALNKVILVPVALLLSAFAPWAIQPLLMLGGGFLCYEGFEKVFHSLFHRSEVASEKQKVREALVDPETDMVAFEQRKIKGAIRTDFILSAEIIVISLGTVQGAAFAQQVGVLVTIAVAITIGVYGTVAGIVKLDDAGLYLQQQSNAASQRLGTPILKICPWLMKTLSVVGTAAMFLVGGGILLHGLPGAHAVVHYLVDLLHLQALPEFAQEMLWGGIVGVFAGGILVLLISSGKSLFSKSAR